MSAGPQGTGLCGGPAEGVQPGAGHVAVDAVQVVVVDGAVAVQLPDQSVWLGVPADGS